MENNQEKEPRNNPLENIIFFSLPEGTERVIEDFVVDSRHLIPVELPPGKTEADLTDLSWEMIISAMLKIFAYQPDHEDIEYYRQFIRTVQPNLSAELTRSGIIKAESKDFDVAEEIFLALKNYMPEEPVTYLNLAFVYEEMWTTLEKTGSPLQESCLEKAFTAYRDGLERHPEFPELQINAGYFFLKINSLSKALEHFELFLGLEPEDERSPEVKKIADQIRLQNLDDEIFAEAFDLIRMNHEDEAISRAEEFLKRNPDVWNGWFLKGWAQRRLGNYAEARDSLNKCLDYIQDNADIYNELSICCMELGDFSSAATHLRKALSIEPENVKIISNFGVLEMKKGNDTEAARFFRAAMEIDPDDPIAAEYLSKLT